MGTGAKASTLGRCPGSGGTLRGMSRLPDHRIAPGLLGSGRTDGDQSTQRWDRPERPSTKKGRRILVPSAHMRPTGFTRPMGDVPFPAHGLPRVRVARQSLRALSPHAGPSRPRPFLPFLRALVIEETRSKVNDWWHCFEVSSHENAITSPSCCQRRRIKRSW